MKKIENLPWGIRANADFGYILLEKKTNKQKKTAQGEFFTLFSRECSLVRSYSTGFFRTSSISSSGFIAVFFFCITKN
jgi:hypothetical protein